MASFRELAWRTGVAPRYQQIVDSPTELVENPRSDILYIIDGAIDLGDQSIKVPAGGLQIAGLGFDVSSITANGPVFTRNGTYSGNLQCADLTLTSPSVFDLDNAENGGAIECVSVNFLNCDSLGTLSAYRQGLFNGIGAIFCDDGVIMDDVWAGGFAAIDSIIIGGMTGSLFKAGPSLTVGGSFRSNINALQISAAGSVCDFAPSNILSDGGFSMTDVRVGNGANGFPNMPHGSVKARFRNCQGQANTYPGIQYSFTNVATTVITAANTLAKLAGVTTVADAQWFSMTGNNQATYASAQPIDVEIKCVVTITGNNADQVEIVIRQWDASAGVYLNLSQSGAATLNAAGRAEGIASFAYASIATNDRIEVWIRNLTNSNNVTAQIGGLIGVTER